MKKRFFKKSFFRKTVCIAVFLLLAASWDAAASQTNDKLKAAGKKIDELEDQMEGAQEKVGELREEEGNLKGELAGFNSQLAEVSAQINDLEAQIGEKKTAIKKTGKELEKAVNTKEEQYESMKLRIRFIYESGGADLAAALLGSNSLAEFLNKAEYVVEINRYDRRMLQNYEETCRQISQKKKDLQTEKKELTAMQETMEQRKEEVNGLIAKTQASIQAKQTEISNAQETVNEYEAQIQKMKAYEEELERKKAEEAKKRAAEQKKAAEQQKRESEKNKGSKGSEPVPSGGGSVTSNASDLAMLAALVECEAGGESYEGQWAVASVVVNRVRSGSFPNTISGVIYQGGQFSPVASGRFAMALARGASKSCTQAANAALSGSVNLNCLYFCRASSGVSGTVIGNHVFY